MGVLSKIRGLWRFDGDEEPVLVSRRTFLSVGGMVLAGAAVPNVFESLAPPSDLITVVTDVDYATGTVTLETLFKEQYRDLVPSLYERDPGLEALFSRIERGRMAWEGDTFVPVPRRGQ